MYPHRIRLRGPWNADGKKVQMPGPWPDPGPVRIARAFGYPGRIDDFERVWLVAENLHRPASVVLNGNILGDADEWNVTSLLRPRNLLEIEMPTAPTAGPLWEEVVLEVRCSAYLKNVRVMGTQLLGEILGECSGPLEVYAMIDGRHAGYQMFPGVDGVQAFAVELAETGRSLRVDLVNISSVWFRVERTL